TMTTPRVYQTRIRSLARSREAEIDLARARIRPARGDDLGPRVELEALGAVHVEVAEQAVLPAAEAVVGDRHRDRHVDADHPRVDLELELPGGSAIASEDGGPVAVRVVVDEADGFFIGLDPHHGQDRAEDLVAIA